MDTELFKLTKEVFKRTDWVEQAYYSRHPDVQEEGVAPFYTTGYLLDQLAPGVGLDHIEPEDGSEAFWAAHKRLFREHPTAETHLKALLKLVIALDDADKLLEK